MSVPRFLFLAIPGAVPRIGGGAQEDGAAEYLWRLVAGNNHVLGRSPTRYADLDQCREAIHRLTDDMAGAVHRQAPESRPGHWCWQLELPVDRRVLAMSARGYERQRESRSSLENFLAAVPVAVVVNTVVVRPRSRRLQRSGLTLPDPDQDRVIPSQQQDRDTSEPRTGAPAGAGSPLPPE